MSNEVWQDVKGFEGFYKISNLGNLKSIKRTVRNTDGTRVVPETIMKFTVRSGYYNVILHKYGRRFSRQIHRLVAEAFIPNPQGFPVVNHKDSNRKNNNVENLEWCTQLHNVKWSAHKMRKPKSTTSSSCGEKYISSRGGNYRVYIRQLGIDRTFKTITEAVAYRNEVIKNKSEYFENDRKGVCYLCKKFTPTEVHHIIGGALRKKSDTDGLTVNLCHWCHNEPPRGVHQNRANDLFLKQMAESAWCQVYGKTVEDFIKRFGKNYL